MGNYAMKIDVLTTTRAEYGLLRPLINRLILDSYFEMRLIVTGAHLSAKYGYTYEEIEKDGFPIYKKIEILSDSSGVNMVSETMANALTSFTAHFTIDRPDFLLVDGDRYETMAVCIAAVNSNVPIIHLGGGDTTEGATDECYRHAISKMSYLHFPIHEVHKKRIIQMGESPERVFSVGTLGIENILETQFLNKFDLSKQLKMNLDVPYSVVTFHPVTLEHDTAINQLEELLNACDDIEDMSFVFTMANADRGGEDINSRIQEYVKKNPKKAICVSSLGTVRYLSALKYCEFVMGNSSSGITEAPSMRIPTINIGDRQKGRIQAKSIINCKPNREDIVKAINKARSYEMKRVCLSVTNPYGDGQTSEKIVSIIKKYCTDNKIDIKKKFYDLEIRDGFGFL